MSIELEQIVEAILEINGEFYDKMDCWDQSYLLLTTDGYVTIA